VFSERWCNILSVMFGNNMRCECCTWKRAPNVSKMLSHEAIVWQFLLTSKLVMPKYS